MPIVRINGVDLYCEQTGAGDPVVLVHGSWTDHRTWDRIVPVLARSFRVLTYDRRGHSKSARPGGQGSIHKDVADLAALIEQSLLAPAHVVGNSFGGSITLRLASERPDLFRSVHVHEPPLRGLLEDRGVHSSLASREQSVLGLLEKGQTEAGARQFAETIVGPGSWDRFPPERRETWVFNALTYLDEQRDPEWLALHLPRLATFSRPVLLTHGDQSDPTFALILDRLARALPHAEKRVLPGVGHGPQLSHPADYAPIIESFIRSASEGAETTNGLCEPA
jgi:pimeloyl-ACP methyl ester carboxylesterase